MFFRMMIATTLLIPVIALANPAAKCTESECSLLDFPHEYKGLAVDIEKSVSEIGVLIDHDKKQLIMRIATEEGNEQRLPISLSLLTHTFSLQEIAAQFGKKPNPDEFHVMFKTDTLGTALWMTVSAESKNSPVLLRVRLSGSTMVLVTALLFEQNLTSEIAHRMSVLTLEAENIPISKFGNSE